MGVTPWRLECQHVSWLPDLRAPAPAARPTARPASAHARAATSAASALSASDKHWGRVRSASSAKAGRPDAKNFATTAKIHLLAKLASRTAPEAMKEKNIPHCDNH